MPYKRQNDPTRDRGGPYKTKPATDLTRWRLTNVDGRQTWEYLADDKKPEREQTMLELYSLGLDTRKQAPDLLKPNTAKQAAYNGMKFYTKLQAEDGHWAGDFGAPFVGIPSLLIVYHVTGTKLSQHEKLEMIRFIRSIQSSDGGWRLHLEGPSTLFGTTMNYVALRILGLPASDPILVKARKRLHNLGTAKAIPLWGKFWLAVLNVYSWDGIHSLFPELWILPDWLPFHPSKMWCNCRQVHLGMTFCSSMKIKAKDTSLIFELRKELYTDDYDAINWPAQRNNICKADLNTPHSWMLDLAYYAFDFYEKIHFSSLRQKALNKCYEHICADDRFSDCISVGPISKTIQMLARWYIDGPDHPDFIKHKDRSKDYLWMGVDGLKINATDGSQLWDTAFATQALLEAGAEKYEEFSQCLDKSHKFLKITQISENPPDYQKYYRQMCKGGFPFSTRDSGWLVSDCTAEGLKAVLLLQEKCHNLSQIVETDKLYQAVDVLLDLRNADGGFASYETKRGADFLEKLNPSEVFGDLTVDKTFVECTSAIMQALKHFLNRHPEYRDDEIRLTLDDGLNFLKQKQRSDGSWFGSWAVCFTYATWFGLEAYACMGYRYDKNNVPNEVKRACRFLESKQKDDGGWGEMYESAREERYIECERSQVTQTCWALMALMTVRYPHVDVLEKGIKLIMDRQMLNGDWRKENNTGLLNVDCAVCYTNYKNIFPIWTLGRFSLLYSQSKLAV